MHGWARAPTGSSIRDPRHRHRLGMGIASHRIGIGISNFMHPNRRTPALALCRHVHAHWMTHRNNSH
jgi:hypothetical protein